MMSSEDQLTYHRTTLLTHIAMILQQPAQNIWIRIADMFSAAETQTNLLNLTGFSWTNRETTMASMRESIDENERKMEASFVERPPFSVVVGLFEERLDLSKKIFDQEQALFSAIARQMRAANMPLYLVELQWLVAKWLAQVYRSTTETIAPCPLELRKEEYFDFVPDCRQILHWTYLDEPESPSIPVSQDHDGHEGEQEANEWECAICTTDVPENEEMEPNQHQVSCPTCKNRLHSDCMIQWLIRETHTFEHGFTNPVTNKTCPWCRSNLSQEFVLQVVRKRVAYLVQWIEMHWDASWWERA